MDTTGTGTKSSARRPGWWFSILGAGTLLGTLGASLVLPAAGSATPTSTVVPNTALLLSDSVTPGSSEVGPLSLEQYEAQEDGFTVTAVTGAQWDAMTAAQFATYQVLIIGDPTCGSTDNFAAAAADETTWEPVVMNSGGNKVLIGTDPAYHFDGAGGPHANVLVENGIAFAGAVPGATGAYVDLSCAYNDSATGTPVPLLDGLSTFGAGQFKVTGVGPIDACGTGVNIVAASGPTAGLTDADLSDWGCSVHEAFDTFPADYTPLALAPAAEGFPSAYCADDVDTGASACGSPYIMVAGSGVTVNSNVKLTPPTQTLHEGASATVVANVVALTSGSTTTTPVTSGSVVFDVVSGPNVGKTFTGTLDPEGNATFTYTGTGGLGTDQISATYTNAESEIEKGTASVTWIAALTTATTTPPTAGVHTTTVAQAPAAAPVTGATMVHTGEAFAGSRPYLLGVAGLGLSLLALGEVRRRRSRRLAD